MKKSGFTMIELIFVIVILGILAAVAIPKLAATRDDAKNAAIMSQVQSAIQEVPQYVTAHGGEVNATALTTESQVLKQMVDAGTATQKKKDGTNNPDKDHNISILGTDKETRCLSIETNDTGMTVRKYNSSNADKPVCKVIVKKVLNGQDKVTYSIAGSTVSF